MNTGKEKAAQEQFIKDCIDICREHPSVIGVDNCKCCCDGIVVGFKAKFKDSHNYDFDPTQAEWINGQFPSSKMGAIHIKGTGDVEFVGEDDFQGSYYLRYPVELPELIDFYVNAKEYTKLKIKYTKRPIGSLFTTCGKGAWIGLIWLHGVVSTLGDNSWIPPYKGKFRGYIPIIPTVDMPLTFLVEYFIYYTYGNQELQEAVYNSTDGYNYVEAIGWKNTMITIPETKEQQLKWAIEHRILRIFNGRRMGYDER